MDVNELLQLDRPLTDEKTAFMEEQVLQTAKQLHSKLKELTKEHADKPEVQKLLMHSKNTVDNIELAIGPDPAQLAEDDASIARQRAAAVYSWEKLPAYEWNNRFARVIGRLLAQLPKRHHVYGHNLAAQAGIISNCIAMGHRDLAPGETVTVEEVRAYRFIGRQACDTAKQILAELSQQTRLGRHDIAHGLELLEKLEAQLEWDLRELDTPAARALN